MKLLILGTFLLTLGTAAALTEAEFETLYKRLDKDADACYELYKAYRNGDGVEKDETKARKWLLGAHALGKPVADEVASQPWRKKAKLPMGRKTYKTPAEEQKASAQKICDMLHSKSSHFKMTRDRKEWDAQIEKAVKDCLKQGADPNYPAGAHTPLSRALNGNNALLKTSRMLLEAGGDLHANGNACWEAAAFSTIHSLTKKNVARYPKSHFNYRIPCEELFPFMMKNGADLNIIDGYGRPMVMSAMRCMSPLWLEAMCKAGADPNVKASKYEIAGPVNPKSYYNQIFHILDGETPLLHVVRNCDDEMVEVLLRYGADPELANDAGELPLELAKKSLAGDTHESNIPKLQKIISMLEQAIAKKATTAQKGKKSGKKKKSKSKKKK